MKEKLVRNNIPEIIRTVTGKEPKKRKLVFDRDVFLREKLKEEVQELLDAKTDLELVEEMADVYEVMRAMCYDRDLDIDAFEQFSKIKRQTNGDFTDFTVIEVED